jgi:hypothetical protein
MLNADSSMLIDHCAPHSTCLPLHKSFQPASSTSPTQLDSNRPPGQKSFSSVLARVAAAAAALQVALYHSLLQYLQLTLEPASTSGFTCDRSRQNYPSPDMLPSPPILLKRLDDSNHCSCKNSPTPCSCDGPRSMAASNNLLTPCSLIPHPQNSRIHVTTCQH